VAGENVRKVTNEDQMKFKLERCPLCKSEDIHKKEGKRLVRIGDRAAFTPAIEYWECLKCGEVFYPREAAKKIDDAFLARKKRAG